MARVSRKNGVSESPPKGQRQTVFRTALYVRLSVEDNGKADADSIENQELLLRNYLAERPYLELKEVYADEAVIIGLKTLRLIKCQKHGAF